jgi:hypothetical protein
VLALALLAVACADREPTTSSSSRDTSPALGSSADRSAGDDSNRARSAGSRSRTLRFAVTGDHGSGLPEQYAVAERMCSWRRHHPFRLVFTTGDNVYDNGEASRFPDTFFKPYACLLERNAQFRSALGNHDVHTANGNLQVAQAAFGYKGHRKNYVVRKKGVRFVVANATDLRENWLRRETRAQRGDRWTVVVLHYPIYSSGGYETYDDWRDWMPDLFVDRGVDLVLNGHDHVYSASKRLRGIRYVVTGGGGASLYACHHRSYTDTCRSRHHFLYVVANRRHLWVRAIPVEGEPFDSFRTKGRRPAG